LVFSSNLCVTRIAVPTIRVTIRFGFTPGMVMIPEPEVSIDVTTSAVAVLVCLAISIIPSKPRLLVRRNLTRRW